MADANAHNKLIYTASDVIRVDMDSLLVVSERRMLSKLQAVSPTHSKDHWRNIFNRTLISPKHRVAQSAMGSHFFLWSSNSFLGVTLSKQSDLTL